MVMDNMNIILTAILLLFILLGAQNSASNVYVFVDCANQVDLLRYGVVNDSFISIQEAVDHIWYPGDVLEIHEGVYYEDVRMIEKYGTKELPIIVRPNREGAVVEVNSANEEYRHTPNDLWKHIGDGVWITPLPAVSCSSRLWTMGYIADPVPVRLYYYNNQKEAEFYQQFYGPGTFANSTHTLIILPGKADPNFVPLHLSRSCETLYLADSRFVIVEGIDFTYAGRWTVLIKNTNDSIFRNSKITGGTTGLYLYGGYRTKVTDLTVFDSLNETWTWSLCKSVDFTGMLIISGSDCVIEYCDVSEYFNEMIIIGDAYYSNNNIEVHHNILHKCMDDCFELDGTIINGSVHDNIVYDAFDTMSLAPIKIGPLYVHRNLFIADWTVNSNFDGDTMNPKCFKLNNNLDGIPSNAKVYHNTCFSTDYGMFGNPIVGKRQKDFEWYNNIFYMIGKTPGNQAYIVSGSGLASDGNVFDSNLYYALYNDNESLAYGDRKYMFKNWNWWADDGVDYRYRSLEEVRNSTFNLECDWESHGIEANPLFVTNPWDDLENLHSSKATFLFHLQKNSPCIDKAIELPLDWPMTFQKIGMKYDIGAFELGFDYGDGIDTSSNNSGIIAIAILIPTAIILGSLSIWFFGIKKKKLGYTINNTNTHNTTSSTTGSSHPQQVQIQMQNPSKSQFQRSLPTIPPQN